MLGYHLSITTEKLVERAVEQQKIKKGGGIQDLLDKIFELNEFRKILRQELASRGLKELDVGRCLSILYPVLSGYAHGNDGHIVHRGLYHWENERAGLVSLLRVQGTWKDPQAWMEEPLEADYLTGGGQVTTGAAPAPPVWAPPPPTTPQFRSPKVSQIWPKKAPAPPVSAPPPPTRPEFRSPKASQIQPKKAPVTPASAPPLPITPQPRSPTGP